MPVFKNDNDKKVCLCAWVVDFHDIMFEVLKYEVCKF